ncbi:hypothetical protein OU798_19830 [Prolixibacteraceae bacterium Z1-6]|uniref:Carboxypeptidase-like regulatory domain-containing protein n=1 Tax=Draconibacterium aestuarii TaxID=2998507 RepID=A0A9X3J9B9_9BACT|nr:hypothetical protein [Prolixibacteraceae bacterium Z1-6]
MTAKVHIQPALLLVSILCFLSVSGGKSYAQNYIVCGKIHCFKNLALENIQITSKKTKQVTSSNADGTFSITCHKNDKLILLGQGFERITQKVTEGESPTIKLIFKGGSYALKKAIASEHVSKNELIFAVNNYSYYNNHTQLNLLEHNFSHKYHIKRKQVFTHNFTRHNIIYPDYYSNLNYKNY